MLDSFLKAIAHRMWLPREPTIEEMLSDTIVQAVMEADDVEPAALASLLRNIAAHSVTTYSPAANRQDTSGRTSPTGSGAIGSTTVRAPACPAARLANAPSENF